VTVQSGIKLWQLSDALAARGLALPNSGTQCTQTIAGATATATHGTGTTLPSMSSAIKALRLVLADGSVVVASAAVNPELLAAARVGWGALGILSTVTLSVVPAFKLERIVVGPLTRADTLRYLPVLRESFDRVSFTYFPYPRAPEDTIIILYAPVAADTAIGSGCWADNDASPPRTPAPAAMGTGGAWPGAGTSSCIDWSHRALVLQGNTAEGCPVAWGTAMEMVVPADQAASVLDQLIARQAELRPTYDTGKGTVAQTDVRYVAADDSHMSPYFGRASAVLSTGMLGDVATGRQPDAGQTEAYLRALQTIAISVGGRPHPGKRHYMTAAQLRSAFPRYCRFVALRRLLDPSGVFTTAYLDAVLSPAVCTADELSLSDFALDRGTGGGERGGGGTGMWLAATRACGRRLPREAGGASPLRCDVCHVRCVCRCGDAHDHPDGIPSSRGRDGDHGPRERPRLPGLAAGGAVHRRARRQLVDQAATQRRSAAGPHRHV
jgi:L-gulono-1,4-lactone dehydrogenase